VSETPPPAPGPRWRRRTLAGLLLLGLVLVVGGVAVAGLWQVSGSPRFCASCHIMEPYVEAWKVSKHKAVACVECHYPPELRDTMRVKLQAMTQVAKWATGTYSSKPFAEVADASCFRSGCHAPAALRARGPVTFAGGVRFDHGPHLDSARVGHQLRCTSCHSQIVVERHFEVATSTCFVCHFKGMRSGRELTPVGGCTGCHEPPKGDISVGSVTFNHEEVVRRGVACQKCHLNVVAGEGEAPRERCFGCHNQAEKVARYAQTSLVHAVHVAEHPIECTRCHTEIKHQLPPPIGAPRAGHSLLSAVTLLLGWQ
jgi:nitrate/TMAO reductase-like tetraheme cytochrome c subunit